MNIQGCTVGSDYRSGRNIGLDLLKVVSMIGVVLHHILGHGAVLNGATPSLLNYEIAWGLEGLALCAVNTYVMITGYVYAGRTGRVSNLVGLWMETFFYSVVLTAALFCMGFNVGKKDLAWCVFPVLGSRYWFFNRYFALFLFIPFLNRVCADRRTLKAVLLSGLCVFSALPILGRGDDLFNANGYSALWFVYLYWTGAYIKLYGLPERLKKYAGAVYPASAAVMLISREIRRVPLLVKLGYTTDLFYSYTSPLVFLCAVCLVSLFSEMKIRSQKAGSIFRKLASLTFGVYLIHDNQRIRDFFISGRFQSYSAEPAPQMVLHVFGTVFAVFAVCCLIDAMRSLLFRLIGVSRWSAAVGERAEKAWGSIVDRL